MEFVQFLQNPDKFKILGAKLPKGERAHFEFNRYTEAHHIWICLHTGPGPSAVLRANAACLRETGSLLAQLHGYF
eukprot:scaffold209939_cov17-Tisochrysis_lutea.AAC.2